MWLQKILHASYISTKEEPNGILSTENSYVRQRTINALGFKKLKSIWIENEAIPDFNAQTGNSFHIERKS